MGGWFTRLPGDEYGKPCVTTLDAAANSTCVSKLAYGPSEKETKAKPTRTPSSGACSLRKLLK
jgi:hypothetical protein